MRLYILIFIACFSMSNDSFSQSYSVNWNDGSSTQWVHIFIDTSFSDDGILVYKEFATSSIDTVKEQNSLLLLGDFTWDTDTVILDYENFNYVWVPFDPDLPFYRLDFLGDTTITQGKLRFGLFASSIEGDDKDVWYMCSCNGTGQDTETPGGCLSNLNNRRQVRCLPDGSECSYSCIGDLIDSPYNSLPGFPGGSPGILVQVSPEKRRLVHNFGTGN